MMLLDKVLQPSVISLFSSTASHPLLLASTATSHSLTCDSFISLLGDAADERETLVAWNGRPAELTPRTKSLAAQKQGGSVEAHLRSQVLHLQDPDCRSTSVRWGTWRKERRGEEGLGIELGFLHLQLKNLGQMVYFDVGAMDDRGEVYLIRCSSWQTRPTLLHLPLVFPPASSVLLTPWTTITLPLPALLASLPALGLPPAGRFTYVVSVEVHATCRLRRIWFSQDAAAEVDEAMARRGMMSELGMYAAPSG
ncbi:SPOSA6832_04273, partial [Sporobolomyces salmonicolor]